MDVFSNLSNGTPPCTYMKRQIQDSRGRKPAYVCTSADGQYIAILYFPRSSRSIKKSLCHLDKSVSSAMKMKLRSQIIGESTGYENDVPLYTSYNSYLKFITDLDKFDIYDEIEAFSGFCDDSTKADNKSKPHLNDGKKKFLNLKMANNIDYNENYNAYIVIYDTFFMNPVTEIVLDDFTHLTNKTARGISKRIFHTFFIKFVLGDSFLLCFINDTLWIIHNNYLSHNYFLKLTLVPIKAHNSNGGPVSLDTIDLVSVLKNGFKSTTNDLIHDDCTHTGLIGNFIELNNFPLYQCSHEGYTCELIIHYENQFPIRAAFCHTQQAHNRCDKCVHLKCIEFFSPKIELANITSLSCVASAMIVDCKYVYYDENGSTMECDKPWVDYSNGLEFIEHLITMKDGQIILPAQSANQCYDVYKREFFCNILIATILSHNTGLILVLSDLNRNAIATTTIPHSNSNSPFTIKHSHNCSYICCYSQHLLAIIKLQSSANNTKTNANYLMNVIYMVDPSGDDAVGDFVDVAFGGDPQSRWLYISMHRGTTNDILCLYDLKKLDRQSMTQAKEYTRPHIELNLNSTLLPMCIQIVTVPCSNMLLLMPNHQRYITVLTPEYAENWDNTATRNFKRFPIFSTNKEMLQLHFVWEDVQIEPVAKQTTLPSLTRPTFCYHRGCTGIDSHIKYLYALNLELNIRYNQHSSGVPGIYSIWPCMESLLSVSDCCTNAAEIKLPPLRRVRYYGLDCINKFQTECDNCISERFDGSGICTSISRSIYGVTTSLMDEIYSLHKKGLLRSNNWCQSMLFYGNNYLKILNQMLEIMASNSNLFSVEHFNDYGDRLAKLRGFWFARMEDRGIALRKKSASSVPFQSLNRPSTFQILEEYAHLIAEKLDDKRATTSKSDNVEKAAKVARRGTGIADADCQQKRVVRLPNGNLVSSDLLSIIPESKLPFSVLNNASLGARVDSLDELKRGTAEVALGMYYLKMELDEKNVKLPKNLRKLLAFLAQASVAHHTYVNSQHHN
ncbi:hypothetical protein BMR1_01G03110 [Babesia microti strain RI]|uniref:Uncharacterized protein n=1 Tax=Babesia microti (strain RI) TaxID=1133968 RepID=I7I8D1_BABMR|nr:hypothetical protein BMR1_01G03110 [Babesia microti strain RI]CCF73078.1 hypothetical protein BMR1_01G03110 [Babesia microti strain RI]|eukprot:XP_012647687.1 hypothetical protein BMR1_01G03110 [Babesia microti strain RI]